MVDNFFFCSGRIPKKYPGRYWLALSRQPIATLYNKNKHLGWINFLHVERPYNSWYYSLITRRQGATLSHQNFMHLINNINFELDKIYQWCISNRLSFNAETTELLLTREIPAFGGISLALRGNGALGATFRWKIPVYGRSQAVCSGGWIHFY